MNATLAPEPLRVFHFLCYVDESERCEAEGLVECNWPAALPPLVDLKGALDTLVAAGLVKRERDTYLIDPEVAKVVSAQIPEDIRRAIDREINLFWH